MPIADSGPIDGRLSAPWWRRRRLLPWVIAAVAVLAAAIGIGVFVVDESDQSKVDESDPSKPVAQLTPQGQPENAAVPVDDEVPVRYGLTVADFVSYGSYGPLRIWSTTKLEDKRCIAVVRENHISVFECTPPSVDTIADYDMDELPPAPSGELTPYVRFVLHDEVVDVYRPTEPGEFYGSLPRESQTPRQTIVTADYRFENSLADSVGAATELSSIGAHATGFIDEAVLGQTRPVLTYDGPLSASDVAALAAELLITPPTLADVEPSLRDEAAAGRFSGDGKRMCSVGSSKRVCRKT